MTEQYKKRLIELARSLEVILASPGQIVDPEGYSVKVKEKANHLVGYILALEELGKDINVPTKKYEKEL